MAVQRQYEPTTIFNARIVDMRHLWTPSDTYKGQKTQKPNYFAIFIVPKTQAHWSQEPVFAGAMTAFGKLLQGQLQAFAQQPAMVQWPIADGDMPNADGKSSEFAKRHWIFSASSGNPPNVELVQAGGTLVKLQNKVGVKSGDFVMCGVTAAVKANQPNGVKFYLNAVVFSSPGEEIVFANSVSGAELMRMAQQQGLQPAGFSASPGGFPGGFAPQGAPGGFTPPGGFAPTQGSPAPGFSPGPNPPAAVPNWTGGPGNGSAFPSNPQGQQPGFAPVQQPGNAAMQFPSNPAPFPGQR